MKKSAFVFTLFELIAEVLPIAQGLIMLLLLHELERAVQHLRRDACCSCGCESMRSSSCTSDNLKIYIMSAAAVAVVVVVVMVVMLVVLVVVAASMVMTVMIMTLNKMTVYLV